MPSAPDISSGPTRKPEHCIHCGNALDRFWREEDGPFCCAGCRTVYHLIRGEGLERYYDLRPDTVPPAGTLRPDTYAWLDSVFDHAEGGRLPISLDIQGVHCAACVWLIEELHSRENEGGSLRINPSLGKVDLVWRGGRKRLKQWLALVEKFGYRFGPSRKRTSRSSRSLQVRMGICIALAMNVMIFSASFYFGLSAADGLVYRFFGWLNFALASIVVVVGGSVFLRAAWQGLRRGLSHLDLPISLGILMAWAGSTWTFFQSGPEAAYFDTLAIFVSLMLVGRWVQERILERNRNALLSADGVDNLFTRRYRDGVLESASATSLKAKDDIWIAPGDLLPVDAILLRSDAQLALDWITGESEIRKYASGDLLPAGAFNAGASGFRATTTQSFAESRLSDLLRQSPTEPEDRAGRKWWHRISTIYVAAVLTMALAGFLAWLGKDLQKAIEVSVAILVITCPCSLGLATPLARELIQAALRRRGVFVRRAGFFERALSVRKVLFDKTGTLSTGSLSLRDDARQALQALDDVERRVLLNMVGRSRHPVSRTLTGYLSKLAMMPESESVVEIAGRGLEWRYRSHTWRLGRADFAVPGEKSEGTVFSRDGLALARIGFEESLRPGAIAEVQALANDGYEVHLLSGDDPVKVSAAAARLGIEALRARGGLDPEAKAALVRDLDRADTLMVGDGLNDAPSFSAAHCAATPAIDNAALPARADFFYLGDGISALRRALASATRLRRMILLNLAFATVYNLAAVTLAITGVVTPLLAAVLMPTSSVLIVSYTVWRLSGRRLAWMS